MRSFTFDAKTVKGPFKPSRAAENDFYRQLKKVAHVTGHLIDQHVTEGVIISRDKEMMNELTRYSEKLTPWARKQSAKLLEQVQKSNRRAYARKSKTIGRALDIGVADAETGMTALALLNEQVGLIKSIPIEAGLRAQKIAFDAFLKGKRATPDEGVVDELRREMGMTTEVAVNRAKLIARTETARANASFNQARAMAVGSGQYRWHNSGDGAVRESHRVYHGKRLQGMIFSWDNPPTLDDGMTGHPGTFPNCRCFAEPIFGDE